MVLLQNKVKRALILICLILSGEAIFFLPFVLARIFKPTFLAAFHVTNLQLGACFSLYGIVAMVSYFFGGTLADKFPSRNLIAWALWLTGLGGIIAALFPSYTTLLIVYAYWGATTILLLWAALIRATREWGTENTQGRTFGFLEGGRGVSAAALGTLALFLFSGKNTGKGRADAGQQLASSFLWIVSFTACLTILCGFLVWYLVPKKVMKEAQQTTSFQTVVKVIKKPGVWLQAVIIVCAYVGYKITDNYSLYAHEVMGFDEVDSAKVGICTVWARPVFALMAGFLADRYQGSKITLVCFFLMFVGGFFIYLDVFHQMMGLTFLMLGTALAGIYGIRSIYFALFGEARIPLSATGTAVGIMSVIGYTPDIFISALTGYLLDHNPGLTGHRYVFLVFACFSLAGIFATVLFRKILR